MGTPENGPRQGESPAGGEELVAAARDAAGRAYQPYSGVSVGAALRTTGGEVFTGCNVENASYGLTICAERTAVVRAVADGHREFDAIAIVTDRKRALMPCGACRQFLQEFAPGLHVWVAGSDGPVVSTTLEKLLPEAFGPSALS